MTKQYKQAKFDPAIYKAVRKFLDGIAKKHGLKAARHAATKWGNGQREKASLLKQREALSRSLADVSKRLAT